MKEQEQKIKEERAKEFLLEYHGNNPSDWLFQKREVVEKLMALFAVDEMKKEKQKEACEFAEWIDEKGYMRIDDKDWGEHIGKWTDDWMTGFLTTSELFAKFLEAKNR